MVLSILFLCAKIHNLFEIAKLLLVILMFYGDFHNKTDNGIPPQHKYRISKSYATPIFSPNLD